MSQYLRSRAPGGTYYFVGRLLDRRATVLTDCIGLLRDCTAATVAEFPMTIDHAVVLPAEVHMVWTLPPGDADHSGRWRHLKAGFSRHLPVPQTRTAAQARRGEKGIWQPRYWEHLIRDADDLAVHVAHMHAAPVRAGLAARAEDWLFSSIHHRGRAARPIGPMRYPPQMALFAASGQGRVGTRLTP